jgi:dihydroorotate dehydrogenase
MWLKTWGYPQSFPQPVCIQGFTFAVMYAFLKPLIFRIQPEKAHYLTMGLMSFVCRIPLVKSFLTRYYQVVDASLEVEVAGLRFPNRVGLAAGFDKDARWLHEMKTLGFGFVEIGTLTPVGQEGNPKPRLFRLPKDQGVINRMGFNNGGVADAVGRLKQRPSNLIVGGNIGKNKVTPNEEALHDYVTCFDALHPHVDYFAVNVSSPNTPGLRALQDKEPLLKLLEAVIARNVAASPPRPVFLKIAPDLTDGQLDDMIALVQESGIDGIIATNTTIERSGLLTDADQVESMGAGGLSGAPVRKRSTEVIRYLHNASNGAFPIIGVGGICSAEDAQEKLDAGASLIQVYSGLIYAGPGLVKSINRALLKRNRH